MVDKINKEISKLSYEDKKIIYSVNFGLGAYNSGEITDKFILISLVAAASSKLKEKGITTKDFLFKLINPKDNELKEYLEILSIIADDFSYMVNKYEVFGASSSKEIMDKIKNLINTWTPF